MKPVSVCWLKLLKAIVVWTRVIAAEVKHWSDAVCILKLEPIGLYDEFTMGTERKPREDSGVDYPEPMDRWSCCLLRWKRLWAGFGRVGRTKFIPVTFVIPIR